MDPTDDAATRDRRSAFAESLPFPTIALMIVVAAGALFLTGLGWTDLWAPDEPRYAAIAEELRSMRHGLRGLFLLHVNDEVYTQKPPLYFWLAALAGAPGGRVDETAARLPSALAGVASVVVTLWIGRRTLAAPRSSLIAAALLATSYRFIFVARRAQLDGVLVLCVLAAIALFVWLEADESGSKSVAHRRLAIGGLHLALGAGGLVKGPVAWLPLAIFLAYFVWEGRAGAMRRIAPAWALPLSIGPLLAWVAIAVALAPPGYFDVAVVDNVLGRFFAGTSHVRPPYYFLFQLPVDFLPWSLVLPLGLAWLVSTLRRGPASAETARDLESRRWGRLLACWVAVPFVFFSLSAGKRGLYLLPIFPALALITAAGLERALGRLGTSEFLARRRALGALAAVTGIQALLFLVVAPLALDPHKSPRPIAETASAHLGASETIAVYQLGPLEPALAYYDAGPVIGLDDEDALWRHLEIAEGLVLLRTKDFVELTDRHSLRPLEEFRRGRRSLTLARAAQGASLGDDEGSLRDSPPEPRGKRTRSPYARAKPSFSGTAGLPPRAHLR